MVMLRGHGGGCCGINHLYRFGPATNAAEITRCLAQTRQHENCGMLIEAVVTNGQLRAYPNIAEALKETGFKLVARFQNPNSNNLCNVFHFNKRPRKYTRTFGGVDREMVGGGV